MLLTDKKPLNAHFAFKGFSFIVDMSFNNILTVLEVLNDKDLNNLDKAKLTMYLITGDEQFEDDDWFTEESNVEFVEEFITTFFDEMVNVDNTEDYVPTDLLGNPLPVVDEDDEPEKSFDFSYDAGFIYASFMQVYNMDLYEQHGKLHWEVFISLFNSLPSDSMIMNVIDIRTREIPTGKGTEEQANSIRKAKAKYALPEHILHTGGE